MIQAPKPGPNADQVTSHVPSQLSVGIELERVAEIGNPSRLRCSLGAVERLPYKSAILGHSFLVARTRGWWITLLPHLYRAPGTGTTAPTLSCVFQELQVVSLPTPHSIVCSWCIPRETTRPLGEAVGCCRALAYATAGLAVVAITARSGSASGESLV